ncbi:Carbohydrate kinase, FGGY-like protein [Fibrisoma limi BUZ 3]|uniref:Carbohydrate kinase, FGGY-like protein n=1 Tax=Fibrisoma limi BUZ 3 TaxID=1185876 RepID=I2GBN5_9BACT|nr:gluconokinase [Fibrisoma limi]CCH51309.1 Carbohydrate kinase, FGGY-like protein [Fibrisoma limi BUZ 3]
MNCFVGVDIGTTNVKALAMSADLSRIVAHASSTVTTLTPEPGYAEQDPDEIWQALSRVMAEVSREVDADGSTITHVAFSSAMHSLLAMDVDGQPLSKAIVWSDNRAEAQADDLRKGPDKLGQFLYQQTGVPVHPMLPLCKLAWLRENDPRLLRRSAHVGSIKEFLWFRLTGTFEVDYSIATASGLFNATSRQWSEEAMQFAGVRPDQLSALVPTTHRRPLQSNTWTSALGLPVGVELLIGASDGCLANLGAGAVATGITTLTIGTSGAIRQTVRQPLRDPQGRLFCYILDEGYYVVGGPTNNGGNVLEWLSERFMRQETEAVLTQAEEVAAGADGLLFLPYLQGERAPLWDAHARGAYLHVDWQHTQAHFVRAALEGVLLNLLTINELLATKIGATRVIHANGGFAQSAFWVQMLADMAGVPVRLNASNESGAIGAILLTMKAVGLVKSLDEAAERVEFGVTFEPNASRHRLYRDVLRRFQEAIETVE